MAETLPPEEQAENRGSPLNGVIPPTEHRFKPGQSGNPGGRPKGRSVTECLRAILEAREMGGKPAPGGRQISELVAMVLVKGALKGDPRHIKELLDRTEGKVAERHKIVPPIRPIPIKLVEIVRPDGVVEPAFLSSEERST
jgi:hypothetical protein